jgi:hypothetical protein
LTDPPAAGAGARTHRAGGVRPAVERRRPPAPVRRRRRNAECEERQEPELRRCAHFSLARMCSVEDAEEKRTQLLGGGLMARSARRWIADIEQRSTVLI